MSVLVKLLVSNKDKNTLGAQSARANLRIVNRSAAHTRPRSRQTRSDFEADAIMRFVSNNSTFTRKSTRCNVNKAIELIKKHNIEKKTKNTKKAASYLKITHYCKSFQGDKKRMSVVGFSKSLALSEMQSYIAHQDWKHATHLFPKLLEYPIELEPLLWRYMLIILLHTNDFSHLCQFIEQCIGSQSLSNSVLLQRLLLLPLEK